MRNVGGPVGVRAGSTLPSIHGKMRTLDIDKKHAEPKKREEMLNEGLRCIPKDILDIILDYAEDMRRVVREKEEDERLRQREIASRIERERRRQAQRAGLMSKNKPRAGRRWGNGALNRPR